MCIKLGVMRTLHSDTSDFPRVLYSRVLGISTGFLGGPTDRVGDSFNFFVCPLSKLCVSDAHLRIREKHHCDNSMSL